MKKLITLLILVLMVSVLVATAQTLTAVQPNYNTDLLDSKEEQIWVKTIVQPRLNESELQVFFSKAKEQPLKVLMQPTFGLSQSHLP